MMKKVVYFPSCINRLMGVSHDDDNPEPVALALQRLLQKSGYEVIFPENLSNLCCGMAFESKGFREQGRMKSAELEESLRKASENGTHPIITDMSPCFLHMRESFRSSFPIYEPVEFILQFLNDTLHFKIIDETIALHVPCSALKLGMRDNFRRLAELCARTVILPEEIGCCGWAGDRGFTFPELNASALDGLREALPADCRHGYSTSRTCEIGLSLHSGINYTSIIYLVDRCTTPKINPSPGS
jgi:D-lactate dehydrogenase